MIYVIIGLLIVAAASVFFAIEGEIACDEDFDDLEYVKKVVAEDVGKKAVEDGFAEIREQTDLLMCKKAYHYKVYFWK